MQDIPLKLQPCCVHLRHKLMYVDEAQMVPGMVDDQSETRVFWCHVTQDTLGPDNCPADPDACGSAGRPCFKPGPVRPPVPVRDGLA